MVNGWITFTSLPTTRSIRVRYDPKVSLDNLLRQGISSTWSEDDFPIDKLLSVPVQVYFGPFIGGSYKNLGALDVSGS